MIDLKQLNPEQRTAVENTEGPLLVLAGAGSGKTRVLTYRVAMLVEKGVPPWKILAITFTNKAAREMAERIEQLTGAASQDIWVSTFHACCARILRRDIEKLGYKRSFTIYDSDDSLSVIKAGIKKLDLDEKEYPPRAIRTTISNAKNDLLVPEEWLREADPEPRNRKIFEIYRFYEQTLRENNALDFDDLLFRTLELLVTNPPVLDYYRDRFDYILVDEYQDTNRAQYELVKALAGTKRNLCVVGDDDQSIYGWRGADIRNILEFEQDFKGATVVKLEQNYRSTGNILDAANQVISHNAGRKEKALWTESERGKPIALYHGLDERDEAAFISQMAGKLMREEGLKPGQIAVLYRTNAQSRVIEEAFVRARMPYRVFGGMRFYDRKEVKDLIAYMRAAINQDDSVSLRRVINEPKRSIGDSTIARLDSWASENGVPLLTAVLSTEEIELPARAKKAVSGFAALMVELCMLAAEQTPSLFIESLLEKTGYLELLTAEKTAESEERVENIREFQSAATDYEAQHPGATVAEFLENVALVSDIDNLSENDGAITMMTLHSAKGLEFDAVFMAGMEEGVFPLSRAMFDNDLMEEERRLAYVGITRAKKRLFLSHARSRLLFNSRSENGLSRFVEEIPQRLLMDGSRRGETRRVPPPSAGGGYYTGRGAGMSGRRPSAGTDAMGIPGLNRGAGFVGSQARQVKTVTLFAVGDPVIHRSFGRGRVVEIAGEGDAQRITVEFEGRGTRVFDAGIAPIIKAGG